MALFCGLLPLRRRAGLPYSLEQAFQRRIRFFGLRGSLEQDLPHPAAAAEVFGRLRRILGESFAVSIVPGQIKTALEIGERIASSFKERLRPLGVDRHLEHARRIGIAKETAEVSAKAPASRVASRLK